MVASAVLAVACGSDATFCERAAAFQASPPTEGTLEDQVGDALATLDDLVEAAPDEIVGDLAEMRDGVEGFVEARRPPGPEFAAASQRVQKFLVDQCDAPSSST